VKNTLNIIVDARSTQEGFKQHKQRGIGHYGRNLLERLPRVTDELSFTYLVDPDRRIESSLLLPHVSLFPFRTSKSYFDSLKYLKTQFLLASALREHSFDLAHFLFHEDATLTSPFPFCVTIFDTILISAKHLYKPFQNLKHMVSQGVGRHIVKRSIAVFTISEYSKKEIVRNYCVRPEDIYVIYLGVDDCYFRNHPQSLLEGIRNKYCLPCDFFLYVGGIDPRKNVPNLLKALSILCSHDPNFPPLVFVGQISNQKEYPQVLKLIQTLNLKSKVLLVGYVPDDDLPLLFASSRAFVFPSLYEGFGLPIVEAMASGAPVITTRLAAIPEVAGEATLYINAYDPKTIAEGMKSILNNTNLMNRLREEGKRQARKFSWDRTAQETVKAYLSLSKRFKLSDE
jgi:glycosyltransferase involved in cell wall biosynthesis